MRYISEFFCRVPTILVLAGILWSGPGVAETRGFVIYYFHTATHGDERNCPEGDNGDFGDIKLRAFKLHGFSDEKIAKIIGGAIPPFGAEMLDITQTRGRIDGKPANIFQYPMSAPDPELKRVVGPYAYGFDLDQKGPNTAGTFEDPETGEKGVDNQLYRAMGCFVSYNQSLPVRPYMEEQRWTIMGSMMPAWVFTISGEDLSQDGAATVSFYRAIGHRRKNAAGYTLVNATYVIDPNARTYGTLPGVIKDGVFVSDPGGIPIMLEDSFDHLSGVKIELAKARLRLKLDGNDEGGAVGYMGGYQPWLDYWFWLAQMNEINAPDTTGVYHGLRQLADASPDPKTGQNTSISVTYRLDSAPAFLAYPDGRLITD